MKRLRESLAETSVTFNIPELKRGSRKRDKLTAPAVDTKTFFDFRDLFIEKQRPLKRELEGEVPELKREEEDHREGASSRKKRKMVTSVSSSDNSGFSGDSTSSWDQLALREVMLAEENLYFKRWQEFLKEWKREMIENDVRELRNVENVLKHLENVGKDCSRLNLSNFTVENILEVWGEKFLKEFTSIMRNGNQILRGIKRKVKGSLVKGNKMKKSKREEGVSGRSSTNRMAGDVKQALEKVMEDIISLDLDGNIMERMGSLDLNQGEGEKEQGEAQSNNFWRKEAERSGA